MLQGLNKVHSELIAGLKGTLPTKDSNILDKVQCILVTLRNYPELSQGLFEEWGEPTGIGILLNTSPYEVYLIDDMVLLLYDWRVVFLTKSMYASFMEGRLDESWGLLLTSDEVSVIRETFSKF